MVSLQNMCAVNLMCRSKKEGEAALGKAKGCPSESTMCGHSTWAGTFHSQEHGVLILYSGSAYCEVVSKSVCTLLDNAY